MLSPHLGLPGQVAQSYHSSTVIVCLGLCSFPKAAPAPACFSSVLTPGLRDAFGGALGAVPSIALLAAFPSAGLVDPAWPHWESELGGECEA